MTFDVGLVALVEILLDEVGRLAGFAAKGILSPAPPVEARECLARMGLDRPSRLMDHVYAALLKAALAALSARGKAR